MNYYVRTIESIELDETHGTAEALVIPYGKRVPIAEHQPGRGLVRYFETIAPGTFERAERAGAGRIPFVYEHSELFGDRLGVATRMWSESDGLRASLRFDRSKLEAVYDAVTSSHQSISAAFRSIVPKPFSEREGSDVVRRSALLLHIAAVPFPAYEDARVLAVRNVADELDDGETDAERVVREEAEAAAAALREAHELVEAGERWAAFRTT